MDVPQFFINIMNSLIFKGPYADITFLIFILIANLLLLNSFIKHTNSFGFLVLMMGAVNLLIAGLFLNYLSGWFDVSRTLILTWLSASITLMGLGVLISVIR